MSGRVGMNVFEIEARRRKVIDYRLKGYDEPEIAELVGVSSRTIRRDLVASSEQMVRDQRGISAERVATEYMASSDLRIRELFRVYEESNNSAVRLGCLNSMRVEWDSRVQTLQSLGLIYRAPAELQLETQVLQTVFKLERDDALALVNLARKDLTAFKVALRAKYGIDFNRPLERLSAG